MKIMPCPLNGPRNISEFVHGGEVRDMPDPSTCSDRQWADYVFYSDNAAGVVTEWWLHAPSGYWFIAERHTVTDEIIRTYDPAERFSQRVEFSESADAGRGAATAQQGETATAAVTNSADRLATGSEPAQKVTV